MPRTATIRKKSFIWIPRVETPASDLKIDSVSQYTLIWNAQCTRVLCPEIGDFKIVLDNNNSEFTDKYNKGNSVEFFTDLSSGTTKVFEGKIDTLKHRFGGQGYTLAIAGGHISSDDLLLTTITASFSGDTSFKDIIDNLISTFLSGRGYTSNVTATSSIKPTVNWNAKPFWDCIFDLTKLANADAYVNDSKVLQFFDKNSIENNKEAIVWNDTLIDTSGLGTQNLTNRDKIQVIGDDGTGLPVISTSGTGLKEKVLFDTKIATFEQATEISLAELSFLDTDFTEGQVEAFILPTLRPGDKIWITNPPMQIREQDKVYKYTHKFPLERTSIFVETDRNIPLVFKKRIENELALQTIQNPFKMLESLNLTFDNIDELRVLDSNVSVSEGKIRLTSGTEGTFTAIKTFNTTITSIHLLVVGSDLLGTIYQIRKAGETAFQNITPNVEIALDSNQQGAGLELKVSFNSATTEIDSIALLGK